MVDIRANNNDRVMAAVHVCIGNGLVWNDARVGRALGLDRKTVHRALHELAVEGRLALDRAWVTGPRVVSLPDGRATSVPQWMLQAQQAVAA